MRNGDEFKTINRELQSKEQASVFHPVDAIASARIFVMASASSTLFPSFERSISLNDLDSALNMRELVERDVVVPGDASQRFLEEMPQQSFFLPNFEQIETSDYRKFLYSSLVDMEILRELENVNILNWCKDVHPMVPLQTIGDGNCLMHAASLAMWAVNDRYQILRRSVHQSLLEDAQGTELNTPSSGSDWFQPPVVLWNVILVIHGYQQIVEVQIFPNAIADVRDHFRNRLSIKSACCMVLLHISTSHFCEFIIFSYEFDKTWNIFQSRGISHPDWEE